MEATNNGHEMSETEAVVLAIWKDVLKQPDVRTSDNFLDLGGDSLAAMSCISRINKHYQIEFALEEFFFDTATVSEFASIIDQNRSLMST